MPRQRNPKTVTDRTLTFLKDAQRAIRKDNTDARILYVAMTHRLSSTVVAAAQRAGILRRAGWKWHWEAGRVTKELAEMLREEQLKMQREYSKRYNSFAR